MGALLSELAQLAEVDQRWDEIEDAYRRVKADPDAWREYLAELSGWDTPGGGPDGDAAEEWPEYNG